MKRKHFYRLMSMILICTMLIGQLMVGEALAATPIFGDDGSSFTSGTVVSTGGSTPDASGSGNTNNNVSDDPLTIISGGSVSGTENQDVTDPEDLELLASTPVVLADGDDLNSGSGNGGLSILISSSQTEVKDGDSYSFTVTVSDSDLNTAPNINPGDKLTIKLPEFLTAKDMDEVLQNCFQYFEEDYTYENNTLILTFKDSGKGTWTNVQFSITMTASTIGYDGNGKGTIEVGIGDDDTVSDDTNISVDVGTGTGTGEGGNSGSTPSAPYLVKNIWSNYKLSQYGVEGSYVMRDPKAPIGYAVAFGVNQKYTGSAELTDNMSNGNLTLCDKDGNTGVALSRCFTLYVGSEQLNPADNGSSLSYTSKLLGSIVISSSGTGFTVTCTPDPNTPATDDKIVDVVVKYFAVVTGNSNDITNNVSLSIDDGGSYNDSKNIRQYDSQGLVITKSILSNSKSAGTIDLTEQNTVTFRLVMTQYGTGSLYRNGEVISIDTLAPCFRFDYSEVVIAEGSPFKLVQDGNDPQIINIAKNGEGTISTGQYIIDFTVNIIDSGDNELDYGEQATNTVGNTVFIRRMAKLTVNKSWLKDAAGNPVEIGQGAIFTLYDGDEPVADSGEMSNGTSFTLYISADKLADGTHTYTLKETVADDSKYAAAKDIPVVINKDAGTGKVTIVSINGNEYNSGSAEVAVENQPDSGKGSLTFRKYGGSVSDSNLLDGGLYALYRVKADGTQEWIENFSTANGVWTFNDLPYGVYFVRETNAPEGYVLELKDTETVELKKTAPHQSLYLVNQLYRDGQIIIEKKDENGNPLSGVTFTLTSANDVQTQTTGENGVATFTGLEAGSYSIQETLPYGYTGFSGSIFVIIDENGTAQTITAGDITSVSGNKITILWTNTQLFGSLEITKKNPSGIPLQGAAFALYDSSGAEVRNGTTGPDGTLAFEKLPYGVYTLKETAAPDGYVVSPELDRGVSVRISSAQSALSLNFTNETQKGSIEIIKKDKAKPNVELEGAVFGLYSDANAQTLLSTALTGRDGKCRFDNLERGTYYIKEISAPTGYQLNEEIFTVLVGLGDEEKDIELSWARSVPVDDAKCLYGLTVKKTDENGRLPLAGAVFELTGNGITQTAETGDDGIAAFTNLPFGEYTISETKAPDGYALANDITVRIDGSYPSGYVMDAGTVTDNHTKLTVLKVDDKDGSKGLAGTGFVICSGDQYVQASGSDGAYRFTGLSDEGTVFMTGSDGTFVLEYLPLGSYTLVEVQAPDGYVISQEETGFAIIGAENSVTVGNTLIEARLHLVKTDEFGKLLPGIGFTLSTAAGGVQADGQDGSYTYTGLGDTATVLYTGADGSLTVDGLLWGDYTLEEVADTTPAGLNPADSITVYVGVEHHDQTIKVGVENKRVLGRIAFEKLDEQFKPLPGAVFKLELVSGNEYSLNEVMYAVSDADGKVCFENIPYGVYKLSEYLAPYGKELSRDVYYISIGGAEADGVETAEPPTQWTNNDLEIKVTVKKVSTDNTPLYGAVFRITDEAGNDVINPLNINSAIDGEITLPVGVYYIEELIAPANYIKESAPVRFQVTAAGPNEVVLKNAPFTGSLTIRKTDAADDSALSGAEFRVYGREDYAVNVSGATALYTVTTNSDGTAFIDDIPAGDYTVVEVKAPAGYELSDPAVQHFRISNVGEDAAAQVELNFKNQASRYLIAIEKVDINNPNLKLSGAKFAISGSDFYAEVTTGEDGTATIQVPRKGTYNVVEIQAPAGYTIDPNPYTVIVNEHTPEGAAVQARFVSQDYPTRILLQKVDEAGQALDGASFAVCRVSGESESLVSFSLVEGVYVYAPDGGIQEISAGSAVIEQLPIGEYILRETGSPDGYISLGDVKFTVDAGLYDQSLTLTVENIPHSQGVAVCKESTSGIRLAGAEFSLYDGDGNLLDSKTTGASGYAVFTDLPCGSYSLKETKAPAGYQPVGEVFTFEIDGNGEIHQDGFVRAQESYLPFYVLTVTNSPAEQSFRIQKISAVSGKALEGAQFRILGGGTDVVFTAGDDGLTPQITLPVGEYMLTEIKAPNGYLAEEQSHHVLVTEEGIEIDGSPLTDDPMIYTVENCPAPFRLTLIKQDENSKKPLAGAGFTITGQDGSTYSLITDENGQTEALTLQPGTYAISEVLAPEGYNVPLAGWTFTVDEGSMQVSNMSSGAEHSFADGLLTITLTNKRTTGNLMIYKYDAGDESIALADARFMVKDGEGNFVWFTLTNGVYRCADSSTPGAGNVLITNAMGQALLENLPFGNYTVSEWQAPVGYELLTEGITVQVREQDETTLLQIPNEKLIRKVTVLKQSDEEEPVNLIGAVFALYEVGADGSLKYLSEATTLYDGRAEFTVPYGDYVIAEVRAPEGYELSSSSPVSFSYNADTPEDQEFNFIFRNEKSRYSLEIYKYDAENKALGLENAEFAVTDSRGFTKLVTTGPDGVARLDDLTYDDYSIREISAPEGYYLNDQVFTVSREQFRHGVSLRVEVPDTYIVGSVLLRKVDYEDNSLILDAEFSVYDSEDRILSWQETEDGYVLSDEGETVIHAGEVVLSGLPAGTYRISEVEAPEGYLVLDADRSFTINAENALDCMEIEIENIQRKVAVGIIKMDAEDQNKRLEGAEFTLYCFENGSLGDAVMTVETDRNGLAVFADLTAGQYRIIETKAPYGYELWTEPVDFRVDGDGRVFAGKDQAELPLEDGLFMAGLLNQASTLDLTIKKVSSLSGEALPGASFTIIGEDASWRITTGDDGTATMTLPYGKYILQELVAPDGYVLDETKYLITVSENGISVDDTPLADDLTFTVEDSPVPFRLAIIKLDESSRDPLEGAGFTITGQDGSKYSLITDENGQTETLTLQPGTYAISEVLAPKGYNVPLAGWTFTVDEGSMHISEMSGGADYSYTDGLLAITLTNKRTTGNLMIYKYEAGDKSIALADAQFMVTDEEGNSVWFTLEDGIYWYADSDTPGAGNVLITNAMGQALLKGLPFGNYTVSEWQAPEGYKALTEEFTVKVREQDETTQLRISNEKLLRKVTVLKQSDEEEPINLIGAVFALYEVAADGTLNYVSEATTLYNGKAEFTVPYGDYEIAEIKAPEGYELSNSSPVRFSFNADTPEELEFSFVFRNEKSRYSLEIYKYDADNPDHGLENAEFAVTDSLGFTKLVTTGPDGVARLDDIPYDDYSIREVSAPEGYYLNDQVFTVNREQLTHGVTLRVEVPDTYIVGSVLLRKVDYEDNSLILDAEFSVYDSEDRILSWQETEDGYVLSDEGETVIHAGEVVLSGLPAGTYRISEVEAPEGYLVLDADRSFTINAENALDCMEIEIENIQRKVAVGIIKMDAEDHSKRLEGAEFTLYRFDGENLGEAVMTVSSNKNGLVLFTDLTAGQYRIIETKAPDGYKLWTNPVDFSVDGEGRVFAGKDQVELPLEDGVFMAGLLNQACTKDFTIKKVSSIDGTVLSGASFTISRDDASWRITTGEDGTATVTLPYGEYILQELIAPDGYVLDEAKHLITVSESGISVDGTSQNSLTYTMENTPLLIPVMLHKQDSSGGKALSGAEFTVSGGGESYKLVTNASGNTDTLYLRPGTYTISETKVPDGYKKPGSDWTLTVTRDGRVSISGSQATVALNARSAVVTLENTKQSSGGSSGGSGIAKTGQIRNSSALLTGAALMLLSFSGLMAMLISEYKRRRDTFGKI